jgi:fatty acid desaturase
VNNPIPRHRRPYPHGWRLVLAAATMLIALVAAFLGSWVVAVCFGVSAAAWIASTREEQR